MTVGTHNLALSDLLDNISPTTATTKSSSNVELFSSFDVVELQNDRVRFTAFNAWVIPQVSDQPLCSDAMDSLSSLLRILDVALLVPQIMRSMVGLPTGTAVGIEFALRLP
ncbi:MAG: hypothetical protein H0U53_07220 [Actinobacteria bacterium]|nr:hypothetical protein [Actinomycetota bacterium]